MDDGTITWRELWAQTEAQIGDRTTARWLCEEASGTEGGEFLDVLDQLATERTVHHLDAMVERVGEGEPVQYVLGHWAFRHLDLLVDRRVLIPRPETELLIEHAITALEASPRPLTVADLGTGSGAIGLSLATELRHEGLQVWITDASLEALDVARANLAGIGRAGGTVRVAHGSWFDALPEVLRGTLDLVASNPPYIDPDDPDVEPSVRDWEPGAALFAADDGLEHLRRIIAEGPDWLAPGGTLIVEIGSTQGRAVALLMEQAGYHQIAVLPDLAGHHRFVQAKRAAT